MSRLLSKFHSIVEMALFGVFFVKFFDHMFIYALKIFQTRSKIAHFSNQSEFRKKSNVKFAIAFMLMSNGGLYAQEMASLELAKKMQASGRYKGAIKAYLVLSEQASGNQKSDILRYLAESYYKDQDQTRALQTYLEAINAYLPRNTKKEMSPGEKIVYEEALKVYLGVDARDSKTIFTDIRALYAGVYRLHPDYSQLGYLVALASANLGDYPSFFDVFYQSYQQTPEHFLAYKTRAILYIKLYDRAKTVEEKNSLKHKILGSVQKAKEMFPQDPALYKMDTAFSLDKEEAVERNLKEIIDNNIVVPRSDLTFYIDQILAYGKLELGAEFIQKASSWYPYSRTLEKAKEIIQEKTKGK